MFIILSQGLTILIHLGMTGKFFIVNKNGIKSKTSFYYQINDKDHKHNHIIFHLSKNTKLIYNDVRKFGFIKIFPSNKLKQNSHLKFLGPEPLSAKFDLKYFKKYIINKKRKLKDILMDQKFVSGLGNIYVNEILFLSKLKPTKTTRSLKNSDMIKILYFTRKILRSSIKTGGSSIKILRIVSVSAVNFNNSSMFMHEMARNVLKINVVALLKKAIFLIDHHFFVQLVKNKKLTLIF